MIAMRVSKAVQAGVVFVNTYRPFRPPLLVALKIGVWRARIHGKIILILKLLD